MASVALTQTWLNDSADLSDAVALWSDIVAGDESLDGQIQTYASGRRRLITRPGVTTTRQVTFAPVEPADLTWLRDHRGRTVLLRDRSGLKVWGTYLSLSVTPLPNRNAYTVGLSFESLTFSEAV